MRAGVTPLGRAQRVDVQGKVTMESWETCPPQDAEVVTLEREVE